MGGTAGFALYCLAGRRPSVTRETFFVAPRTGHSIHEMLGGLSRGVCEGSASRASFFLAPFQSRG